jgi:hypothetical protein
MTLKQTLTVTIMAMLLCVSLLANVITVAGLINLRNETHTEVIYLHPFVPSAEEYRQDNQLPAYMQGRK